MRKRALAAAAALGLVGVASACGSGSAKSDASPSAGDAAPPDAEPCAFSRCGEECVDTTSDPAHCGACSAACAPSQSCQSSSCECPAVSFSEEEFVLAEMDPEMLAPALLGVGAYADGDELHALVIGYLDPETPLDTDIDLSGSELGQAPFVGVGYDVDLSSREPKSSFASTSGTLRLTRRCAEGVAGSVTDVVVVELDPDAEGAPLEDGCTLTIPSLTFDFGSDC